MSILLLEHHFDHAVFRCNDCGVEWTVREGTEHRHKCEFYWLDSEETDQ